MHLPLVTSEAREDTDLEVVTARLKGSRETSRPPVDHHRRVVQTSSPGSNSSPPTSPLMKVAKSGARTVTR